MTFEELQLMIKNNNAKFTRDTIVSLLDRVYSSKKLDKAYLIDVVNAGSSEVSETYGDDYKEFFHNKLPNDIIEIDPKHAIFLGDIYESEFLVNEHYHGNSAEAKEDTLRFKETLINGKKDASGNTIYPGISYLAKDNSRYILLVSDLLFPNISEFRNSEPIEHELVINANCQNYIRVFREIYNELISKKIPFNFKIRKPGNMKYGYADPIVIYTSTKHLNDVLTAIDNMTKKYGDKLLPPPIVTANINNQFGYASMEPNSQRTNYDIIAEVITNTIDQHLSNYAASNPSILEDVQPNWISRVMNIQIIRNKDNQYYQGMIDHIVSSIQELNINRENLYLSMEFNENQYNKEEGIIDNMDRLDKAFDFQLSRLRRIDTHSKDTPVEQMPIKPVSMPEELPKVNSEGYVMDPNNGTIIPTSELPTPEVSSVVSETPQPQPAAVTPVNSVQKDVRPEWDPIVQHVFPRGPQDTTPIPRNEINNAVASSPIPEDVTSQTISNALDSLEEEQVSMNTGSYSTVPIEVTGLNNAEVKSIINDGVPVNNNINLYEYADIITPEEGAQTVVDKNGWDVRLIDYLTSENVSTQIPFDSSIVLNDDNVVSGIDFIKTILIPIIKENTPEVAYGAQDILNMYAKDIRLPNAPKEKGLFGKFFNKK